MIFFLEEITQAQFPDGHDVRFQRLPNQFAPDSDSGIISPGCGVADEVRNRRLLPLRRLLCLARFHINSIEQQYIKVKSAWRGNDN